jgi:hypothetical protein
MQDPEVNDLTLNVDNNDPSSATVSYDVRIVRVSSCCGDEMKEYSFADDADVPENIIAKMKDILEGSADKESDPEAEFEVEEEGVDQLEEGGHRYKKSYYGFTLNVSIKYKGDTLGSFEITDNVQASGMDELV